MGNFGKLKKYIFVLFLVGFLVYANCLGNEFVWDDEEMVIKNFSFFQLKNLPRLFTQATFYSGGSSLFGWFYRPLVMSAFLLIKVIFGTSPFGFHFNQIIFHLVNGVLLFLIFRKLLDNKGSKFKNKLSFCLAMAFIVHPAHVEAVSYIASVAEPLYTNFLLIIFLIVLRSKEKVFSGKKSMVVSLLFLLALLTKEGAIIFFSIVLFYVYLFQKKNLSYWLTYLGIGFILYLGIRLTFFGIQTEKPFFINPIGQASFNQRLSTLPYILFSFLKTFFFPKDLSISQHLVVGQVDIYNFWLPLLSVGLFMIVSLIFLYKTKDKLASFFFFWFVISVIPVSNLFFPLDMTFAERWLYFPMIGLLGFLGAVFGDFLDNKAKAGQVILISLLFLNIAFGLRTIARNKVWKDGYSLYSHDINLQPKSYDLHNNLAVELFRQGEKEQAFVHFQRSIELEPGWAISNNNLGAIYEGRGDLENAERYYQKSIELGAYYLAYENYAQFLLRQKRFKEAEEFIKAQALRVFPQNHKLLKLYRDVLKN